jgi:hypothetical protein
MLSVPLHQAALYGRLRQLIRFHTARKDHVVALALEQLKRLPELSPQAIDAHGRCLAAWLRELLADGEVEHADALIASLAAIESLTGRKQRPETLEWLVAERADALTFLGPGTLDALALELVAACPSRRRKHWDRVRALLTAATQWHAGAAQTPSADRAPGPPGPR